MKNIGGLIFLREKSKEKVPLGESGKMKMQYKKASVRLKVC